MFKRVVSFREFRDTLSDTVCGTRQLMSEDGGEAGQSPSYTDSPGVAGQKTGSGERSKQNKNEKPERITTKEETREREDTNVEGSEQTEGRYQETRENAQVEEKEFPLPENWPNIEQLERPRSCANTASRLSCVRKAVSHLELLQNTVDDWSRRLVEEAEKKDRLAASRSNRSTVVLPREPRRLLVLENILAWLKEVYLKPGQKKYIVPGKYLLAKMPLAAGDVAKTSAGKTIKIPYLGADDVIEDTIILLARLEIDRQETEKKYEMEMKLACQLQKRLHSFCLLRLKKMPGYVQRLHTTFSHDYEETLWNIENARKREFQLQNLPCFKENKILNDDVKSFKQKVVETRKRVDKEMKEIEELRRAKAEADKELIETKKRKAKTQEKMSQSQKMVEEERRNHFWEITNTRDNLSKVTDELYIEQLAQRSLIQNLNNARDFLADTGRQLLVLETQEARARADEKPYRVHVNILREKLMEANLVYENFEEKNKRALTELTLLKEKNATTLAGLTEAFEVAEMKLLELLPQNVLLSQIVRGLKTELDRLIHLQTEMFRDKETLRLLKKEQGPLLAMNRALREQMKEQKNTANEVRGQIMLSQAMCRDLLQQRTQNTELRLVLENITAEIRRLRDLLVKREKDFFDLKSKLDTEAEGLLNNIYKLRHQRFSTDQEVSGVEWRLSELKGAIPKLRQSLQVIESPFFALKGELQNLENFIDAMEFSVQVIEEDRRKIAVQNICLTYRIKREQRKEPCRLPVSASDSDLLPWRKPGWRGFDDRCTQSDTDLLRDKKASRPRLRFVMRLERQTAELDKILEHLAWKTRVMQDRIKSLDHDGERSKRELAKLLCSFPRLQTELQLVLADVERIKQTDGSQRKQCNEIIARIKIAEERHKTYLGGRNQVLKGVKEDISRQLFRNKELAARYRCLTNEFLAEKEKTLHRSKECLQLEACVRDAKRLGSMESKHQSALAAYFKLRGLRFSGDLVQLQNEVAENIPILERLPSDMEQAVSLVTEFLEREKSVTRASTWKPDSAHEDGQRDTTET